MKARGRISSRDHLSPSRPALSRLAQPVSALSRLLTASSTTALAALRPQLLPQPTKPPWAPARASRGAGGFSKRHSLLPITSNSTGCSQDRLVPALLSLLSPPRDALCRTPQPQVGLRHAGEASATLPRTAGGSQQGIVWQRETSKNRRHL